LPAQGIDSREQGIRRKTDPRPDASDGVAIFHRGRYKNNQQHGCVCRAVTLDFSGPDAPWMRLSSPGSNPQTTDENVFAA
jgi:hypothetical protein